MKVQVRNLTKTFGRTKAVDNISFSFDSGHIFGFVGPNGAGKTTTMRIISTLEEPDSGDVYLDGVSVREQPEVARRLVGYVPDSLPAHNDVTVHEYLDFYARAYGLRGKTRKEAVAAIEEFTNVTGILDKHLKALSKGMKQRVTLGRALVHDPHILVLDEPAAGLDPRARVELRELLSVLAEQKKAILISSHILTELTEICNGVVIIEKGQVLETGTIDAVLKKSSPRRGLSIRVLDRQRDLLKELLQSPQVADAKENGREILLELNGEESKAAELLAELVGKGFKVVEFKQSKTNLEDIFMNVTKGGVQ
jgi:ABC-2 type transport system ATP-binding protein